jgi:hypothetical protein
MGLAHLVTALGAELGAVFRLGPAMRTFILGAQRLAAFGAELGALRPGPTTWAEGHGLAGNVDVLGQILVADFFLDLLDRYLRLGRRKLGLDVRGTVVAKTPLVVPAHRQANPMCALGALAEIRLGFLDPFAESFVVTGTSDHALNFIAAGARPAENAAEYVACSPQGSCGKTSHGRLEFGLETVAASVAEELELIALIGGMIGVVPCELDQGHSFSYTYTQRQRLLRTRDREASWQQM